MTFEPGQGGLGPEQQTGTVRRRRFPFQHQQSIGAVGDQLQVFPVAGRHAHGRGRLGYQLANLGQQPGKIALQWLTQQLWQRPAQQGIRIDRPLHDEPLLFVHGQYSTVRHQATGDMHRLAIAVVQRDRTGQLVIGLLQVQYSMLCFSSARPCQPAKMKIPRPGSQEQGISLSRGLLLFTDFDGNGLRLIVLSEKPERGGAGNEYGEHKDVNSM